MNEEIAKQIVTEYTYLIGERWINKSNGIIDTVISIKMKKEIMDWSVIVELTPKAENGILETKQYSLSYFLKEFEKFV